MTPPEPRDRRPHLARDPYPWDAVLRLLQRAFAAMEGRIDPPSSLHRLTAADLAASWELWAVGRPAVACLVLTPEPDALYLGRLAVDPAWRGQGLARALVAVAETRARALGRPRLRLQTRVELTENHAVFRALGFAETGRSAHPGFARPTFVTFSRPVPAGPPPAPPTGPSPGRR
jgi:GNAT superfamily N-acetyltransferase